MPTYTEKYNLRKPATTDYVNVETDIDDNLDKIDNLALMNRNNKSDEDAALYWTDGIFMINAPTKFQQIMQPAIITNRNVGGTYAENGKWQPVIKARIGTSSNVAYSCALLFSTPAPAYYTNNSGLCFISCRNDVYERLRFVWMCGNVNVNNYKVARETRTENGADVDYFCVYAKKSSSSPAYLVSILSQWSSSSRVSPEIWTAPEQEYVAAENTYKYEDAWPQREDDGSGNIVGVNIQATSTIGTLTS